MKSALPRQLGLMIERNAIAHALLFSGPKGSGKTEAALAFAKEVICRETPEALKKINSNNHPDIHHYRIEGKSGIHSIGTLRQLSYEVALCPNESTYKFFILHEAERMPLTSSNALLKTFEEPAQNTVIILLSSHPERLLPTVVSRCQTIPFTAKKKCLADPIQKEISQILNLPKPIAFHTLAEKVATIAKTHESDKKKWEKEMRQNMPKELTPSQKETFQKEIEGILALRSLEISDTWLTQILKWVRDQDITFYPIAEKAVDEAKTAFCRSMKLAPILEILFLRLIT